MALRLSFDDHPAPAEWQERVRAVDPDLVVAWNPVHPAGGRWCILRFHGQVDPQSEPLWMGSHLPGYAYVATLEALDGRKRDFDPDDDVAALRRCDWRNQYGASGFAAAYKLRLEQKQIRDAKDAADRQVFTDAWNDMMADPYCTSGRTGVLVPRAVGSG